MTRHRCQCRFKQETPCDEGVICGFCSGFVIEREITPELREKGREALEQLDRAALDAETTNLTLLGKQFRLWYTPLATYIGALEADVVDLHKGGGNRGRCFDGRSGRIKPTACFLCRHLNEGAS